MIEETVRIEVTEGRSVTVIQTAQQGQSTGWKLVYAPGAGSNLNDRFGSYLCGHLAEQGFATARFQFPYMEENKRRPDRPAILEATWQTVIEHVRADGLKLAVGGRSMGGRIASQVVAKGTPVDALVLFAYPLIPPWAPEKVRDQHLPEINVATLFCSGTRDQFANPEQLSEAASRVRDSEAHLLQGADHGPKIR